MKEKCSSSTFVLQTEFLLQSVKGNEMEEERRGLPHLTTETHKSTQSLKETLKASSVRLCVCTLLGLNNRCRKTIEKRTFQLFSGLFLLRRDFEIIKERHARWSRGSVLTSGWIGGRVKVKEKKNKEWEGGVGGKRQEQKLKEQNIFVKWRWKREKDREREQISWLNLEEMSALHEG